MPKGTVSKTPIKKDLKSLPGGFVKLRKLPYGLLLDRRDNSSKMSMSGAQGNDTMDLHMMQHWARMYDFEHCIVEHNIEDDDGKLLDFSNALSFEILDPAIGQEIETLIDEINGEATMEEIANFQKRLDESSQQEKQEDTASMK